MNGSRASQLLAIWSLEAAALRPDQCPAQQLAIDHVKDAGKAILVEPLS
jgi:hypothetical protein